MLSGPAVAKDVKCKRGGLNDNRQVAVSVYTSSSQIRPSHPLALLKETQDLVLGARALGFRVSPNL